MADVLHGEVIMNTDPPPVKKVEPKPTQVIDVDTSEPVVENNPFQPQKFKEAVVKAAVITGSQIPVVNAIGDVLREERQRIAVEAGKAAVQSVYVKETQTPIKPIEKSFFEKIKDLFN